MSAVFSRKRLATACELSPPRSASGLRLMNRLPRLTEAFHPVVPMEEPMPATAGSARTTASAFCCSSYMVWNETSVEAMVPPKIKPVSSCGKYPLGART
jgi:hypothetical protein